MKQRTKSKSARNCSHHWKIETPRGPVCQAICLRCGAESEFQSAAEHQWVTKAEVQSDAA